MFKDSGRLNINFTVNYIQSLQKYNMFDMKSILGWGGLYINQKEASADKEAMGENHHRRPWKSKSGTHRRSWNWNAQEMASYQLISQWQLLKGA